MMIKYQCFVLAADSSPIDGKWSRWTPYSACSVTCGGGVQQRNRLCDNPPPHNGGSDCFGRDTTTRSCAEWECPGKSISETVARLQLPG